MTPLQAYQHDIEHKNFTKDSAQYQAVLALDELHHTLVIESKPKSYFTVLFSKLTKSETERIQGLYMWGGVGRGKTYLMDLFFDSLPFEQKLREHFHRFMLRVHKLLEQNHGKKNPLVIVGKTLAKQYRVICFDEFFVSDITDAMLLGGLFEVLLNEGVVLVATSNIVPDDLYPNGLQRARFLPAIALINQHCKILNVDAGNDYRMLTLEQAEIFHSPCDAKAKVLLDGYFAQLTNGHSSGKSNIDILGRSIDVIDESEGVLYLSFRAICDGPRSQSDYIELAKTYHSVLIYGVEAMGAEGVGDDIARRFLAMIDEFYDRRVNVIIASDTSIEHIYRDGRLSFEFARCRSRLIEMQSKQYLKEAHLP